MEIRAIIPAAGKGTRLHSEQFDAPKAMRLCAGKPLLETVLDSVSFVNKENIYIVVGYKKEHILQYFQQPYHFVEQIQQRGTGDAVMACADAFRDFDGVVLVTFGDMPLFRREDMQAMCRKVEEEGADCVLMSAENPELDQWARIIRDENGDFQAIIEGRDCTKEQAKTRELFAGVLCFRSPSLFSILPQVGHDNAQGEYYLTEVPELMVKNHMKVSTYAIKDGNDLRGVNTLEDLERCEAELNKRLTSK